MQAVKPLEADATPAAFDEVKNALEEAVKEGVFPGAVLLVGQRGKVLFHSAVGTRAHKGPKTLDVSPMSADTVFDIGSLTSSVVTTTLIFRLAEEGLLSLSDRVSRYLQGFSVFGKGPITVGHLLSGTSGLTHWHAFYEELIRENAGSRMGILASDGAQDYVLNSIVRSQPKNEVGVKHLPSDVGFMLLGFLIERVTGMPLDKAAHRYLAQPLGLKSTSYINLSRMKRKGLQPVTDLIAPTEECPWRKRVLCGEVQDDNAWAMGGIAGHNGLFSTANDLHIFASELLLAFEEKSNFMQKGSVDTILEGVTLTGIPAIKYGWETPSKENGMLDTGLSPLALGAHGFTGCSLWIDPTGGLDIVLLTNRINISRSNKKIQTFRPEITKAVVKAAHHG